jgi:hypothetical protein
MDQFYKKSEKHLFDSAHIGIEAQEFIKSELYAKIIERSQAQSQEAILKLIDADPEDQKEIRKLQNEIRVAEMFQKFVVDCINDGIIAESAIDGGSGFVGDDDLFENNGDE